MIFFIASLFAQLTFAADFHSPFLGFEMPEGFTCKKNTGTYICLREDGPKMKDEVIVVSFKRAGPQDALPQYHAQMRQPRTIRDKNKVALLSQVLSVNDITANAVPWVESQHLNSEIEDYYTAYWVTKVGGVGMLIAYSAHKNKKAEWMKNSQAIRFSLAVDGSAAEAVLNQSASAPHPDLEDPTAPGVAKTHWEPVAPPTSKNTLVSRLISGTISIGSFSMKKSHALLATAALIAAVLVAFALRR